MSAIFAPASKNGFYVVKGVLVFRSFGKSTVLSDALVFDGYAEGGDVTVSARSASDARVFAMQVTAEEASDALKKLPPECIMLTASRKFHGVVDCVSDAIVRAREAILGPAIPIPEGLFGR